MHSSITCRYKIKFIEQIIYAGLSAQQSSGVNNRPVDDGPIDDGPMIAHYGNK
jgi:hypothetical protein